MAQTTRTAPAREPELEAIAHAAARRLQARADENPAAIDDAHQTLLAAANAAMHAGHTLSAIADAERHGERAARDEVGSDALKRVERTARKARDARAEHEQAVLHAIRLGLSTRDVAQAATVTHGTIRAITVRAAGHPHSDASTPTDAADLVGEERTAPEALNA